jgi:uncharacterized protein YegJ (DUF2314 family)
MTSRFLVVVAVIAACKREVPHPKPESSPTVTTSSEPRDGAAVQPGTLRRSEPRVQYVILVPAPHDVDAVVAHVRERAAAAKLVATVDSVSMDDLSLPHDALDALPESEMKRIATTKGALRLTATGSNGISLVRDAAAVVHEAAASIQGWVIEPELDRIRTADEFGAKLPGASSKIENLIMLQAIAGDQNVPYLYTRGMARFGLPELYLAAVGQSQMRVAGGLLNAAAYTLIEHPDVTAPGELSVDVVALTPKLDAGEVAKKGGSGTAHWKLQWSTGHAGEHPELVVQLVPSGGDTVEAFSALVDEVTGKQDDAPSMVDASDLNRLAIANRARDELRKLRGHFADGVPPKERLGVKAPFDAPGGSTEWMWIDVVKWHGDVLEGTLDNDPVLVPLKAGARVSTTIDKIGDYHHVRSDGSEVGDLAAHAKP